MISTISDFLTAIGLRVSFGDIAGEAFVPGVAIKEGVIVIDTATILFPGDILHEAGHLAVLSPCERKLANGSMSDNAGFEMAAIGWSCAAAQHLEIPLAVVFHQGGYKGASESLIENFEAGRYLGVPVLEWLGLSAGEKRAKELGIQPYPAMMKWLRE